jgi:hypothetical protein
MEWKQTNKNSLTLQANYTDRATATCRRNLVPTFVDRGVLRGQRGGSPMVVSLSFLDRHMKTQNWSEDSECKKQTENWEETKSD